MRWDFKKLIVWQKSINLVKVIYVLSKNFPQSELYCLTSQIRRSAISIPSNIAEGNQRWSEKEFMQFLRIALWSTAELETQVILAQELWYIADNVVYNNIQDNLLEVRRLLQWLQKKLSEV